MLASNSSITQRTIDNLMDKLASKGPNVLYGIVIFIIGFYLSKWAKRLIIKCLTKYNLNKGISNFIVYGIYILMLSVLAMSCLEMIGIRTTSVVAVLGAAGFSIGLAFKEILSNLGSGMIILFFKPFKIDDYIQGSGVEGFVSDIQIFSTVLKTPDNKTIIVPNFKLTSNNIINYTNQDKRRVDFLYNISYSSNIELVKKILRDIFEEESRILKEPEPIIGINSIGNNTIQIIARPWVNTDDYWDVYFDTMEKVKYKFDENDIKIPFLPEILYNNNELSFTNQNNNKIM
ncbi:mechanosensitive ion channel family protein [Romboutsia maritimum]|uniref:Mechanosensitive ion channel family protein n=1 Tax=Romboutsia maritimum TaxID=2020948 RepID=A0A371IPY9_9FIRM|nr:mechanosensitive ion channel domain-containing protein [Romboutsia maritimum]RDY22532.1 mechanosensitive ion channel family protein [Romboutsia maritimum]